MRPDRKHLVKDFKNSFVECIEFINCCRNATDSKDINKILDMINRVLPYKSCAVFQVNVDRQNKIKDYKKIGHRSEDSYWENYTKRKYVLIDPVITQSIEYSTPIVWRDTYSAYRNKNENVSDLFRTTEENNLQNGITFSFNKKDSPNVFIIFSLCFEKFCNDPVLIHKLDVLLPYTYKPILDIFKNKSYNESLSHNLTSREREVLKWVTQGKTSWETGMILSISERTVKFHLNNTYQKLNVTNRTQAITTAINHGII